MGFRRYVAPSAREALERIRKELGPDAIILSNRRSDSTGRVEIIAATPDQVNALVDEVGAPAGRSAGRGTAPADARARPSQTMATAPAQPASVSRVAPQSFQEFIRQQAPLLQGRNVPMAATGPAAARQVDGLAMYNEVSSEAAQAAEMAAAPRRAPDAAAAPAAAPAVFRRRPSRLSETAATMPLAAPAAVVPQAMAAPTALAAVVAPPVAQAAGGAQVTSPAQSAVVAPVAPVAPAPAFAMPAAAPVAAASPPAAIPAAPIPAAAIPAAAPAPVTAPMAVPMAVAPPPVTVAPAATPLPATVSPVHPGAPAVDAVLMAELQSLRSALSDRLTNLEAQLTPKPAPAPVPVPLPAAPLTEAAPAVRRRALTRLIMSGFSPELARRIAEASPPNLDAKATDAWLHDHIARQLRCPAEADNLLFAPGAAALVGPTGVGKTTTVAKLAARFVVRHGAAALGLITLDSYRMGAHEQLRSYGRILGVPVQVAHDAASLRDQLVALQGKRKVLIDTCGLSQRDSRLGEMLAMLADARLGGQPIQRVLLINAASHAETLDEVARAWRVSASHGAVLTKIDEAARIGGGLDAVIRYQLPLLGLTNGQRVPEDWHPANPGLLAHIALKPFGAAFSLEGKELDALSGSGAALV